MMDAANTWTDERVELLRKLWATGKSASQIAGQIGGGITRNAVIGKVHRLGLSGRGKTKAAAPAVRRAVKTEAPVEPQRVVTPRVAAAPPVIREVVEAEVVAISVSDVAIPPSARVTLVELRESSCRWPLGDPMSPEFGFCGAQSVPSLPYCPHHCQIAYQPVADRRRERKVS